MELTPEMLAQLNTYTRRTFAADEVYAFKVRLCDNEIDRDGERFSLKALEQLRELFIGKTGVFDHNPSGEKQNARIFSTVLETDAQKRTSADEPYTALCAYAYMVRTEGNSDLIREIDGGIKKEVSISCSASSRTCSICGKDKRTSPCTHMSGQEYSGRKCHVVLDGITDAYEWSFVAVPAQRNAGVTKHYGSDEKSAAELTELQQKLFHCETLLRKMEEDVRREITALQFCAGETVCKALRRAAERMELEELLALRDELLAQQEKKAAVQLHAHLPVGTVRNSGENLDAFSIR